MTTPTTLNDLQVNHITLVFGRKANPAQFESTSLEVTLNLTTSPAAGDELDAALQEVERRVETQLAANAQRRQWFARFFSTLMKFNIPAEDAEQALRVLGLPYPRTVADYQAVISVINDLAFGGLDGLPDDWVWFKDGKHPHPRLKAVAADVSQASDPDLEDVEPDQLLVDE